MKKLKFRDDDAAMERLSRVQSEIDDYASSHPGELSEEEHLEFRELLSERAAALSEATGMKIHSIFD